MGSLVVKQRPNWCTMVIELGVHNPPNRPLLPEPPDLDSSMEEDGSSTATKFRVSHVLIKLPLPEAGAPEPRCSYGGRWDNCSSRSNRDGCYNQKHCEKEGGMELQKLGQLFDLMGQAQISKEKKWDSNKGNYFLDSTGQVRLNVGKKWVLQKQQVESNFGTANFVEQKGFGATKLAFKHVIILVLLNKIVACWVDFCSRHIMATMKMFWVVGQLICAHPL